MAVITPVVNGQVVNKNDPSIKKEEDKTNLDKNAFLQLLVAEMQNQDPLEPTTNTEYISQLATFSSLEEMQNMTKSMDFFRASTLVGQEVYIKTNNGVSGELSYIHGNVDYITYENGEPMVNVNGNSYPLVDVDSIYDQKYSNAYDKAFNWTVALNKAPGVNSLTYEDKEKIYSIRDVLNGMSDYEKSFLTKENQDKAQALIERMDVIVQNIEKKEETSDKDDSQKESDDITDEQLEAITGDLQEADSDSE